MTINRNEVHFEPEFCIPLHQIRQAVLLYLLCIKDRSKPKSSARQRESDLKGAPSALFRHSEMELVQCISQPLCRPGGARVALPHGDPLQWPPRQMLECQGASQVLFLSQLLDISLNTSQPPVITTLSLQNDSRLSQWVNPDLAVGDVTTEARVVATNWRTTNLIIIR